MCSPHTLYFVGTSGGPPGGADNSTVIDSVSLNTASEPAALGILSLGSLALLARRRR